MWQSVLMRAIPIPIRKRILELYERDRSTREIAQFSGFCIAAVRRVRQQFRERRTLEPRTYLCGRKTLYVEGRVAAADQSLGRARDDHQQLLGVELLGDVPLDDPLGLEATQTGRRHVAEPGPLHREVSSALGGALRVCA